MGRLLVMVRGEHSQIEAAALSGLTQPRISALEHGRGRPLDAAAASAYAAALGAPPALTRELVEASQVKAAAHAVPRTVILRNATVIQERIRDYVAAAEQVLTWSTDLIPGELQTPDWTRAMLAGEGEGDPGEEWWTARRDRVKLLGEPGRRWRYLLSEGALAWKLHDRTVANAQLRHLVALSRRPNVEIGVADLARPKRMVAAYGFHLYDPAAVEIPTDVGSSFRTDPDELEYFRRRYDMLHGECLHDDDARALIEKIARRR